MPQSIPESIVRFLIEHIDSVRQLEILLLMRRGSERSWSATEVEDALGIGSGTAEPELEALSCRSLLDVRFGAELRYRFAPSGCDIRGAMDSVASLYHATPGVIVELLQAGRA
jgi:hypothetical protein